MVQIQSCFFSLCILKKLIAFFIGAPYILLPFKELFPEPSFSICMVKSSLPSLIGLAFFYFLLREFFLQPPQESWYIHNCVCGTYLQCSTIAFVCFLFHVSVHKIIKASTPMMRMRELKSNWRSWNSMKWALILWSNFTPVNQFCYG